MEFKDFIFYSFSAILLFSAVRVIMARNPVHAALFLVLAFFTAGGIWMLLKAEFLAITLVLVYVGAVMVLFLFVVMMLDINIESVRKGFWSHLPVGATVGGLMVYEMLLVLTGDYFGNKALPAPAEPGAGYSNTKELAKLIFTEYVYPFEVASIVLLVAIIAAVAITMRQRKDTKSVNPADQVKVKAADRMRVVSMSAEKPASAPND